MIAPLVDQQSCQHAHIRRAAREDGRRGLGTDDLAASLQPVHRADEFEDRVARRPLGKTPGHLLADALLLVIRQGIQRRIVDLDFFDDGIVSKAKSRREDRVFGPDLGLVLVGDSRIVVRSPRGVSPWKGSS